MIKYYLVLTNKDKTMINHLVLYTDDHDNQERSISVPFLNKTFRSNGNSIEPFFSAMNTIKDHLNHQGKSFVTIAWQGDAEPIRHDIILKGSSYNIFKNNVKQQIENKQDVETYNFWDLVKGDDNDDIRN